MKVFVFVLCAFSLCAADLTGRWTGTAEVTDPSGKTKRESIYLQLRQSGEQVTGQIGSIGAQEFDISHGKIEGDRVTFVVQPDGADPWSFRLSLSADSLAGDSTATNTGKEVRGRVALKRE